MLDKKWLLTSAAIGSFDPLAQAWEGRGAGVFIYDDPFTWYVTAYNLIKNKNSKMLSVIVDNNKTKHSLIDIDSLHLQHKLGWIVDDAGDIAATLFPSNPDFILKSIPKSSFITSSEMQPTMTCYAVGFPYSLARTDMDCIRPYVVDGIISGLDKERERIHVTLPMYLGNRGGPIFIIKDTSNMSVYFGGVIVDRVHVNDSTSAGVHLTTVSPPEIIASLLSSQEALILKNRLKG